MMKLVASIIFLLVATASGATRITSAANTPLPTRAQWNLALPFRPGDGETANINPPRFSWSYTLTSQAINSDFNERNFQFQCSRTNSFETTNLVVDVRTPYNWYNFIAPFTNTTVYWRVGYVSEVTNWGATRSFFITNNTPQWDRSMFASTNYLGPIATNNVHPRILFNAGTQLSCSNYLRTNNSAAWIAITNACLTYVTQSWWNVDVPTNYYFSDHIVALATTALVWKMTGNPAFTNGLVDFLEKSAISYVTKFQDQTDAGASGNSDRHYGLSLGLSFDWLYDMLTPSCKSNMVYAMRAHALYVMHGIEFVWQTIPGEDTNRIYPRPWYVERFSNMKMGTSHPISTWSASVPIALAAWEQDTNILQLMQASLHYMIAETYPFGQDDGGNDQGHQYANLGMFYLTPALYVHLLTHTVFPAAQWNKNPWHSENIDWWTRWLPVGFREHHNPWADTGWESSSSDWAIRDMGRDWAHFTSNGVLRTHWENQDVLTPNTAQEGYYRILVPFLFPAPARATNNTLAQAFLASGWVMGNSKSPQAFDAWTNGVGFVFQARPQGPNPGSHSHPNDGNFQLWAYGAPITDSGQEGITSYPNIPLSHYTLGVDGLQEYAPQYQHETNYCQITAFTNGGDFVYTSADLTKVYGRTNFVALGFTIGGNAYHSTYTANNSTGHLHYVSLVKRHLLFNRHKYWVIYDELQTVGTNSFFQWVYHVLEDTAVVNTNDSSFTYTATNYTGGAVTTYVAHVVAANKLALTHLTGTNVKSNPVTGENYWTADVDTHPRKHAVWVQNVTPTTNWHFMSVIYPVPPGGTAPTITRVDDWTVAVTNGAEGDVISFDYNSPTATLIIENVATNEVAAYVNRASLTGPATLSGKVNF